MIGLYRAALSPILVHQASKTRSTMLHLPEARGPRTGRFGESGDVVAVRALYVGDSTIAGVGVERQCEGMVAQSASFLHETIRRPVAWELIARTGLTTRDALDLVSRASLEPADLLVVSLGVNDVTSQRAPDAFHADYAELIEYLVHRVSPRGVIVNGLPPFYISATPQPLRWYINAYGKRLDARLRALVAGDERLRYVSLEWATEPDDLASDGFHPGPAMYQQWARLVARCAASVS